MQVPGSKIEHRQQSVTALAPIKSTSFLSGGTDCTIKHWDLRNTNNQCECYIFKDHSSPISVLKPVGGDSPGQANDKFSFVSGSNSGEVMLFEQ
jgi:WD40 repeat protein